MLRYAIEIAEALDRAHREGVTHRDLKPGNVMITKAGAKLLDFGLAKLKPASPVQLAGAAPMAARDPLTASGTILGTLEYMAPEQVEGQPQTSAPTSSRSAQSSTRWRPERRRSRARATRA